MNLKLEAETRKKMGKKAKDLVDDGFVLGNVYGNVKDSIAIKVPFKKLNTVIEEAGRSRPIELTIDGKDKHTVLVDEIERNVLTRKVHHVTLHAIKADEKVTTEVPIKFVGEAPAVKTGKVLITILDTLEVEALPMALPEFIEADVSGLEEVNDDIRIEDLQIPSEVEVLQDKELLVAKIDIPKVEEEPEEDEEIDAADVPSEHGADEEDEEGQEDKDKQEDKGKGEEEAKEEQ